MKTLLVALAFAVAPSKAGKLEPKMSLPMSKAELHTWSYCPAKSLVAQVSGHDLYLQHLDLEKRKLETLSQEPIDSWAMAFSSDCSALIASEDAGKDDQRTHSAAIWHLENGKLKNRSQLGVYKLPASAIALSEDGQWVVVATNGGQLFVYRRDPKAGATEQTDATAEKLGADGKTHDSLLTMTLSHGKVLTGSYEGWVRLYTLDSATGKLSAPQTLLSPVAPTRDTGSLDVDTGAIVMPGGARVFTVAFNADASRAWASVESGAVFTWDLSGKSTKGEKAIDHLDAAYNLALAPDGKSLAIYTNTLAQLWKLDGAKATLQSNLEGLDHAGKYVSVRDFRWIAPGKLACGTGDLSQSKLVVYSP